MRGPASCRTGWHFAEGRRRLPDLHEASLSELGRLLADHTISALELVRASLDRIAAMDHVGPELRAVIEINPDAEDVARKLDDERGREGTRGPLYGVPILLKDNIDTADAMHTTAGSLALLGGSRTRDAGVASRLRQAGAIFIGKANMSEWANFRSSHSSSGWSARGGQARNPYVLDRSPIGSSSGSASAVAAGYVPVSLGTETSGSIICPAAACGVVGMKPTVGLTSRDGVIPISHVQDSVGPFGRCVEDVAVVLQAICDTRMGYASSPHTFAPDALRGARLGVPRSLFFGYDREADLVVEIALRELSDAGAEIIDPVEIPSADVLRAEEGLVLSVLLYEFKADLNAYLAALPPAFPYRSLADLIAFNRDYADAEMPYFGQESFEQAEATSDLCDPRYLAARERCETLSRSAGIDATLQRYRLDALVAPTTSVPWPIDLDSGDPDGGGSCAWLPAVAGYPAISVPVGYVGELPVGMTFFAGANSDARLLALAHAYECRAGGYRSPRYRATISDRHTSPEN